MNHHIMRTMIAIATLLVLACNESPSSEKETTEIQTMDSTAQVVKLQAEQLDQQTRKVEESIEKLNKEFDTE